MTTTTAGMDPHRLRWNQKLALVRHNLHTASITRDFGFFRCLQATNLVNGVDQFAALSSLLGDDDGSADILILSLDKFNAVMACVHEDAYKHVYDLVNARLAEGFATFDTLKSLYHTEAPCQRQTAGSSIDKMFNAAVDAICQHPEEVRDAAAEVFIVGCTFTAIAMETALNHLDMMQHDLDDSTSLRASWATVQAAVAQSVSGSKGVFKLMGDSSNNSPVEGPRRRHDRSGSVDGYAKSIVRRMSTAFSSPLSPSPLSSSSLSSGLSSSLSSSTDSRKTSSASYASAPSRRGSTASFVSPARARTLSNAIVNWGPRPSHCGPTSAMSPIPSTPPTGEARIGVNPFDATFANNAAFTR